MNEDSTDAAIEAAKQRIAERRLQYDAFLEGLQEDIRRMRREERKQTIIAALIGAGIGIFAWWVLH